MTRSGKIDGLRVFDAHNFAWVTRTELIEFRRSLSGRTTSPSETVKVTYPDPQQAVLEARLDSTGLVILADVYYPGWELTIDGKPAPIYRVNGLMRGAVVPSGPHRLVYTYCAAIVPGRPNRLDRWRGCLPYPRLSLREMAGIRRRGCMARLVRGQFSTRRKWIAKLVIARIWSHVRQIGFRPFLTWQWRLTGRGWCSGLGSLRGFLLGSFL